MVAFIEGQDEEMFALARGSVVELEHLRTLSAHDYARFYYQAAKAAEAARK